jgi:hypothetical protein
MSWGMCAHVCLMTWVSCMHGFGNYRGLLRYTCSACRRAFLGQAQLSPGLLLCVEHWTDGGEMRRPTRCS